MSEKLTYTGRVENNRLILPGAKMRKEIAQAFAGKEIEVQVQRKRKHRSNLQNSFYWGVVVPMVQAGIKELGDMVTTEQVHEFLKMRFLKRQRIDEQTGEVIYEYAQSTAALTTVEFMEYISHCQQFAAEYLGVTVPDPISEI